MRFSPDSLSVLGIILQASISRTDIQKMSLISYIFEAFLEQPFGFPLPRALSALVPPLIAPRDNSAPPPAPRRGTLGRGFSTPALRASARNEKEGAPPSLEITLKGLSPYCQGSVPL